MSRYYYFIFTFLFLLSEIQAQQPRMEHYGAEEGLPSTEVYEIFQDSKGYIWLGTDHGVARYDGYEFKTFTTIDGLLGNTVFKIYEDGEGRLWFIPFSGGVFLYDGTKFFPHPASDTIKQQKNTWLGELAFSDNGDVWATYYNDRKSFKFLNLRLDQPLSIDTVKGFPDTEGYLLIGKIVGDKILHRPINDVILDHPLQFKSSNGFLFVKGSRGKERFSPTSKQVGENRFIFMGEKFGELREKEFSPFPAFDNIQLTNFIVDQQDRVWLATIDKGLIIWDKKIGITNLVPNLTATDVLIDRDQNYWFSTTQNGVYKIPSVIFLTFDQQNGIIEDKIAHICNIDDELYFSTLGSYIYKINKNQEVEFVKSFETNPKTSKLLNQNGQLVIVAKEDRLNKIYPELYFGRTGEVVGDSIYIGTLNNLAIFSKNRLIHEMKYFGLRTIALEIGHDGQLWAGTLEGLFHYNNSEYIPLEKEHESYGTRIADLLVHPSSGKLFVGTKGRGILIRERPGAPRIINSEDGLNSDLIECLFFENDSVLWVGSYEGLNKVYLAPDRDYEVKYIEAFTTSDGLPSNEVNEIDFAQGKIWIATNKGLSFFTPSKLKECTAVPLVHFIKLTVNDEEIAIDGDESHTYQFASEQKNITFEYIGISTREKVEYQYRLLGHNKNWQTTMNLNRPYTNLDDGSYTFELRARNKSGTNYSDVKRIHFYIEQHFILSKWFATMLVTALFLVVGIIAFLIIRYNQLKSQKEKRVLISEQKALRSQMNPHFIFNAMNSIQYFIADNDKRNASIFLARFSSLIRKILDNSKHNFISLEEELSSLKAYLELEKLRFGEKFDYQITIAKKLNRFELEIPSMMIQPFLENAIWHGLTPKKSKGKLDLNFYIQDNKLFCEIADNGIGRRAAAKTRKKRGNHKSTGLKNVAERMKLVNSLFKVDMTISINDLYDDAGQASGTKVIISFPILGER